MRATCFDVGCDASAELVLEKSGAPNETPPGWAVIFERKSINWRRPRWRVACPKHEPTTPGWVCVRLVEQ
jgi:hypothetical protein